GFSHDNFYGAQLFGRVGYHAFEGITLYDDERPRMLESLGDKHVLVLRNHGLAVGEADVARAFFLLWICQRAAEIQCHTGMIPGTDVKLSDEIRLGCARDAAGLITHSSAADLMFDAAVRKMRRERGPLWPGDNAA
ncbi:MAG: class II aldolase/adducin family protein, partial [Gluconacetobacter sp.]